MFYDSMLCPDNSFFYYSALKYQANLEPIKNGCLSGKGELDEKMTYCYVNDKCLCNPGYEVFKRQCLAPCGLFAIRNTYGTCTCLENYVMQNGVCVKVTSDTD